MILRFIRRTISFQITLVAQAIKAKVRSLRDKGGVAQGEASEFFGHVGSKPGRKEAAGASKHV
jgi:hypothetical protein